MWNEIELNPLVCLRIRVSRDSRVQQGFFADITQQVLRCLGYITEKNGIFLHVQHYRYTWKHITPAWREWYRSQIPGRGATHQEPRSWCNQWFYQKPTRGAIYGRLSQCATSQSSQHRIASNAFQWHVMAGGQKYHPPKKMCVFFPLCGSNIGRSHPHPPQSIRQHFVESCASTWGGLSFSHSKSDVGGCVGWECLECQDSWVKTVGFWITSWSQKIRKRGPIQHVWRLQRSEGGGRSETWGICM